MKPKGYSIYQEKNICCEYCGKDVIPSFRMERNHRDYWFCCDSHRTMYFRKVRKAKCG